MLEIPGEQQLFKMMVNCVEELPWQDVYQEWCSAGYNRVQYQDLDIILEVRRGQRIHTQLEGIVMNKLISAGFSLTKTRNWGSKDDLRLGMAVMGKVSGYGQVRFTVMGYTWIEVLVRAQYLLHLLGMNTNSKGDA